MKQKLPDSLSPGQIRLLELLADIAAERYVAEQAKIQQEKPVKPKP